MRPTLLVIGLVWLSACSSPSAPTTSSVAMTNIAGTWNGTFASANNDTEQISMVLTQSDGTVTGTWNSTSVMWQGQVSGTVQASSFSGQITFSGTSASGTVCTGTASVSGSASTPTMSWTSSAGVVGGSCPAPLPAGVKIDVTKQG